MKDYEVKEFIGEDKWEEFLEWMAGQTVSLYKDGDTDFYQSDVERFAGRNRT
jgi:hypothetical protein